MDEQEHWVNKSIDSLVEELQPRAVVLMQADNILQRVQDSRHTDYVGDPDFDDTFNGTLRQFLEKSYLIAELLEHSEYGKSLEDAAFDVPAIKQSVRDCIGLLEEGNYLGIKDNMAKVGQDKMVVRWGVNMAFEPSVMGDVRVIVAFNTLARLHSQLFDIADELDNMTYPVPEKEGTKFYRGLRGILVRSKQAVRDQVSKPESLYTLEIDTLNAQYAYHPGKEEISGNLEEFYSKYAQIVFMLNEPRYRPIFELHKEKDGMGIGGIVESSLKESRERFSKQQFPDQDLKTTYELLGLIIKNSNPDYETKKVLFATAMLFSGMYKISQSMARVSR